MSREWTAGDEEEDLDLIEKALDDAKIATHYAPEDDDFQVSVATCHIRVSLPRRDGLLPDGFFCPVLSCPAM